MKVIVQLSAAAARSQIEVPTEMTADDGKGKRELERSQKGALHFLPGRVKTITADEFEYIEMSEPEFARRLRVVKKIAPKTEAKTAKPSEAKSPQPAENKMQSPPAKTDGKTSKGSK